MACSAADEHCQNLVVILGTYKTVCGRTHAAASREHLAHDVAGTVDSILEPRGVAV